MPNEIRQFFLDPERLETALEIEKHLPDFKRWLYETFCHDVRRLTKQRLSKQPIANGDDRSPWVFWFDDDFFGGSNFKPSRGWRIAWRDRLSQGSQLYFSVKVEFDPGKGLFYGITRGVGIPEAKQVPQDKDIRKRLEKLGFDWKTEHFLGRQFFRDLGLPRFDLSRVDDVLELCREMQNDDRPLTHRVVELTWKLFCDFRRELETLNPKYPYDPPADANA